jgi:hypothetical protein
LAFSYWFDYTLVSQLREDLLLCSSYLPLGVPNELFLQAISNQGKVIFNVNDKEHTVYFPNKIDRKYGLNSIKNIETIIVGEIYCSRQKPQEEYKIVMVGTMPIKVEVT